MLRNRFFSTAGIRLFVLAAFLNCAGCIAVGVGTKPQRHVESPDNELWVREELTFGSDIPGGGIVSESDWQKFLDEVITPRFPDGFSVSSGYGQYRMKTDEIVKEKGWTVVIYLPELTPEKGRAIEEIIATYKQRFRQESVLRVSSKARVRFE